MAIEAKDNDGNGKEGPKIASEEQNISEGLAPS